MRTEELGHLKIFKDPTVNRAWYLPSGGADPQPSDLSLPSFREWHTEMIGKVIQSRRNSD
jgi:hypothetical protein